MKWDRIQQSICLFLPLLFVIGIGLPLSAQSELLQPINTENLDSLEEIWSFKPETSVWEITNIEEGYLIATALPDNTVELATVDIRGTPLTTTYLFGHTNRILDIIFIEDGARVITTSLDSTVREWDTSTGREIQKIDVGEPVGNLAISDDSRLLAMTLSRGRIRVWDIVDNDEVAAFSYYGEWPVSSIDFSLDGETLLSTTFPGTMLWSIAIHGEPNVIDAYGGNSALFLTDTEVIIDKDNGYLLYCKIDALPCVNFEQDSPLYTNSPDVNFDGTLLAQSGYDGEIIFWDVESRQNIQSITVAQQRIDRLVFAPDGLLLCFQEADSVHCWGSYSDE